MLCNEVVNFKACGDDTRNVHLENSSTVISLFYAKCLIDLEIVCKQN